MSQSAGHPLAQDPGRHPAPLMLTRFIRMDMREAFHRLKVRLGLERLADVPPGLFDEPDGSVRFRPTLSYLPIHANRRGAPHVCW